MEIDKSIYTLHKYFIWADRMRIHFDNVLKIGVEGYDSKGMFDIEWNIYMSYWYAGMYVLIEGWKEMRLQDSRVDALLKSSNVDLLRRYRNGVCHFQANYWDDRFLDFIKSQDSVPWVRELREAFSDFFLRSFGKI